MRTMILTVALCLLALTSCRQPVQTSHELPGIPDYEGTYVSDGYQLRSEGYDWVAVSVYPLSDTSAHVAVRSRVDLKKATCTFDSDARLIESGELAIPFEDKLFLFSLTGDTLQIAGADEKSRNLLYYFCSGGASLEGRYVRSTDPVEEEQLDSDGFLKKLTLQGISFEVKEINRGFHSMLIIEPSGLETDNSPFTQPIYGWVSGAEVEDLNSDGFPELMVYVKSTQGAVRTEVIAYSVNNGKSMSQVALPDITRNKKATDGFIGYDEFTVVETTLVQRFPLFNRTGSTYEPTGKTRQIQYKLKEGEASRQFILDRITDY
jgi:hypothetical protein